MASRYEVEVLVSSARQLKNVNWRNGDLKPYAVLWIDDGPKCSTRVAIDADDDGGENPTWDDKLTVPLPPSSRLDDAVLYIDVVHANAAAAENGVKPLVGSARLPLRDVLDESGVGGAARVSRSLRLKRPSGRPQGRIDLRLSIRDAARYYDPSPYAQSAAARDPYAAPPPPTYGSGGAYGAAYGAPGVGGYAAPPVGYPTAAAYGGGGEEGEDGDGAAAGVLGGLALAGGASYLEDKFEEGVAEKVDDDFAAGGYDDDY
uniref:C2 domain-containing protein n=1 Tax=Leersia perrieri TaxID=77586 RepID=A0A0D9XAY7_9ORYZ